MAGCRRVTRRPLAPDVKTPLPAWAEVRPRTAPARGGGAGSDVAPSSPSAFSPPVSSFPDAAASCTMNPGILPDLLPSIHAILTQPLQSNCLSSDQPAATICKTEAGYQLKEGEIRPTWQMFWVLTGQERKNHFGLVKLDPEKPSPTILSGTGGTTTGSSIPGKSAS